MTRGAGWRASAQGTPYLEQETVGLVAGRVTPPAHVKPSFVTRTTAGLISREYARQKGKGKGKKD